MDSVDRYAVKHASDISAQMTFLGEDDKRFRREQERRRRPRDKLPNVPDGPCCLRCRHWQEPGSHDDFGVCTMLAFVTVKVGIGPERGTIVSVDEAMQQDEYGFEYLPTRGFLAGCSLYRVSARDAV